MVSNCVGWDCIHWISEEWGVRLIAFKSYKGFHRLDARRIFPMTEELRTRDHNLRIKSRPFKTKRRRTSSIRGWRTFNIINQRAVEVQLLCLFKARIAVYLDIMGIKGYGDNAKRWPWDRLAMIPMNGGVWLYGLMVLLNLLFLCISITYFPIRKAVFLWTEMCFHLCLPCWMQIDIRKICDCKE